MSRRGRGIGRIAPVVTLLLVAGPTQATELLGPGPVASFSGRAPAMLVVNDLNRDGLPDVAHVNWNGDSVSVALGDGRGGFLSVRGFAVCNQPVALVAADLNEDGWPDLAVVCRLDGALSVLLGDGAGGMVEASTTVLGGGFESLAVADFDADGTPDLALADETGGRIRVRFGRGDGSFVSGPDLAVGNDPAFVGAADFDGDEAPDLVVLHPWADTVAVYPADGPGTFADPQEYVVGRDPGFALIVDVNVDGALDLAVTNEGNGSLSILLGDGTGRFGVRPALLLDSASDSVPPGRSRPLALAATALNDDAFPDLVVALGGAGSVVRLLGAGDGTFSRKPETRVEDDLRSVGVADFDSNGAPDLVVTSPTTDTLSLRLGDGLGGFPSTPEGLGAGSTDWRRSIRATDVDADGDLDLLTKQFDVIQVYVGDGTGGFEQGPTLDFDDVDWFEVGYFNDDPYPDLLTTRDNLTAAWLSDGGGGYTRSWTLELPLAFIPALGLGTGDIDGDGRMDITLSAGPVLPALGDGDGGFELDLFALDLFESCALRHAVADFNRDGLVDLAGVGDFQSGIPRDRICIRLADGQGGLLPATFVDVPDLTEFIATGDLDGDGAPDIATSARTGVVTILYNDGQAHFRRDDLAVPARTRALAVADFNGDGANDLIVSHRDLISLLVGKGGGDFLTPVVVVTEAEGGALTVGDLDGDGWPDVAVDDTGDPGAAVLVGNQIELRADVDGSNRVDGQDLARVLRLASSTLDDDDYLDEVDVTLNGVIDGEDLALVTNRFGEVNATVSPLSVLIDRDLPAVEPGTISMRGLPDDAPDVLALDVIVHDEDAPVASADFSIVLVPDDGTEPVFEFAGFDAGTFLDGGVTRLFNVQAMSPDHVAVQVLRFPAELETVGDGPQPLLRLFFRAIRTGEATFEFGPLNRPDPALLDSAGNEAGGLQFVDGIRAGAMANAEEAPSQRIGLSPEAIDFGAVTVGASSRRKLRISNFGFSELHVRDVRSSDEAQLTTFFVAPFDIPAFSYVELFVVFSPSAPGPFAGTLTVESDDVLNELATVPVGGEGIAQI